jgi:arabinogalactan endo-1,4-beta-galactosidase
VTLLFVTTSCMGPQERATGPESPPYHFGVDLSYVNEVEDFGAEFRDDGDLVDPFELFAEAGHTTVRARLWHNPDWTNYSTLEDVARTFKRARENGMALLLDFHYSDEWADPSKQHIPTAWEQMTDEEMAVALHDYTYDTLMTLHREDLLPEMVQIGNETNSGMLKGRGDTNWQRQSLLFNAGINAVREAERRTRQRIEVVVHVAQPENALWFFTSAIEAGITDFDIIGLSYYSEWSNFSMSEAASFVGRMRREFGREVMIVETGYPWTRDLAPETAGNILTQTLRGYPVSIEGQAAFVTDLIQATMDNGGTGTFYWEPAWVPSEATTLWGQGSHWENATFFDFRNGNETLPALRAVAGPFTSTTNPVDGVIEPAYGTPLGTDGSDDHFANQPALDLVAMHGYLEPDYVNIALVIDEPLGETARGVYTVLLDADPGAGATRLDESRPIQITGPNLPDVRLDFSVEEYRGQSYGRLKYSVWDGETWTIDRGLCSYAHAVRDDGTTVIEFKVNRALLPGNGAVQITALTMGKGRAQGAADTFGSVEIPDSWTTPTELTRFFRL